MHQHNLCVRSATLVPDLRARSATAKQRLFAVSDFYYKLGRHREGDTHRLIRTLARAMEITVIWRAEEGKSLKTICSSEIKRDHAQAQPHSLCCRGKEKASAVTRAIWRKIDFQTGVPAYSNQRTEMEWQMRQEDASECLVGIGAPPHKFPLLLLL